jgi:hypothetical protein
VPLRARQLAVALVIGFCAWRGWSTWPAVDRHDDRRGEAVITRLTLGISDPDAMLVSQMNWQLENVLLYMGRTVRPDFTWTRLNDVLPHFPFFVDDQNEISRGVLLTESAAADVIAAYGPLLPIVEDAVAPVLPFSAEAARVPRGAAYVLVMLTPPSDEPFDAADVEAALNSLTGGRPPARTPGHFELIAGLGGEAPSVYRSSDRPFTETFRLADEMPFTVRMDSWLPYDTFRRPGFGHVLRGREHVQIVERGVNLVWVGAGGRVSAPVYAASLFAPRRRFRVVSTGVPALARSISRRLQR